MLLFNNIMLQTYSKDRKTNDKKGTKRYLLANGISIGPGLVHIDINLNRE